MIFPNNIDSLLLTIKAAEFAILYQLQYSKGSGQHSIERHNPSQILRTICISASYKYKFTRWSESSYMQTETSN